MESAMWSVLVVLWGLWVDQSASQVLQSQPAPHLSCFMSCVCQSPSLVSCNITQHFQQKAYEFNQFLQYRYMDPEALVHFHTTSTYLPDFLSRLPMLRKLSLAENQIHVVQNDVLPGLRLRELDLSRNMIKNIQPGAFENLQYLQVLDLSHNNLTSVSKHLFSDMPFLQVLNLDFNQLMYFPVDAFSMVPRLRKLTLNENRVSYMMPGHLSSLTAVQTLSLQNNLLHSFVVDVTNEMPSLAVLDVSGNPFHCGCAVIGLSAVLNSSKVLLKEINQTTCATPLASQGKPVSDVVIEYDNCTAPKATLEFAAQSVQYTADVEVACDVEGDPDPAVLWSTPWGHQFADPLHWNRLKDDCHSCQQQRRYKGIGINLVSTVSVLGNGRKLRITNFRSFFNGNITCHASNFLGNATMLRQVKVSSLVSACVHFSMVIGGFCAAGFFCLGLLIGGLKLLVLACRKHFGKKKKVALTPPLVFSESEEDDSVTEDTHCREDSIDMSDDFYPPETPFTTPVAVSPSMSPRKVHSPSDGMDTPPGGWLPTSILDTMEEVRWRLRYGMGRKMQTMKRNVQSIKESSLRNVQSIKESGSMYVHNIMESGSTAANKVRAGVVMGMETVKYHVQSIKELCGTGDMGAQTISMISVETNLDTNETREVVKSITIV